MKYSNMKGFNVNKNLKIYVSFKNNDDDYKIYKHVRNKGDMSNYIKDLIKNDMFKKN